jgi:hypothetical protein
MKFRKLKVKIITSDENLYGYEIEFSKGLNIIRGDNSSGKSTFVNSLIYAMGMEEIIGSKGPASLPYAVKDKFVIDGVERAIVNSVVYLEIENRDGKIVTLKRVISSGETDTKLVQVINGPYLTGDDNEQYGSLYTFLHDPGSAQDAERGFFAFLEEYLCLKLPIMSDNKGRDAKLYLQSIFSALIVEQKRGWTDYIANIPYYGVNAMREKVASFLIDLDVFRNSKKISDLQYARSKIMSEWGESVSAVKMLLDSKNLSFSGVSKTPVIEFDERLVVFGERTGDAIVSISKIRNNLENEKDIIFKKEKGFIEGNAPEIVEDIRCKQDRIDELLLMQSMCVSQIKLNKAQLNLYKENLGTVDVDLKANKLTLKLVKFGADEMGMDIAKGQCPTCLQPADDILISHDSISMPMTLSENITHLNNQKKMIGSMTEGLEKNIARDEGQVLSINEELVRQRQLLISLKKDIKSIGSVRETDIRSKILIEGRISDISSSEQIFSEYMTKLSLLSKDYKDVNGEISKISARDLTTSDWVKIKMFSQEFKAFATKFGYRSAKVEEIEIKGSSLLPYLKGIELKQNMETPAEKNITNTADIKSDSSASDFVRLIWSYLISLHTTSEKLNGNHPGFLIFDEPAQHSMSVKSVNEMLKTLQSTVGLQSIVAASFDESDVTYNESTVGLKDINLVRLPSKLIMRLK